MKLNREEKEIVRAYEKGRFKSVPHLKKEIGRYREYAKATFQKNKRINIRISERDLIHIQRKAIEEGLPYQTLVSSILHKYIRGMLVEKFSI
jgi:predicted DNA binding CopG/RHH family protein